VVSEAILRCLPDVLPERRLPGKNKAQSFSHYTKDSAYKTLARWGTKVVCGIAGIVQDDHTGLDAALLQSLCYTLRHRGPDDVGFLGWNGTSSVQVSQRPDAVQGSWTALVHRRVALLDL